MHYQALDLMHPAFGAFEGFLPNITQTILRNSPETRDTALYLPFRTALAGASDVIMTLPQLIQGLMGRQIALENQDAVRL
jgi:hypothetical protein